MTLPKEDEDYLTNPTAVVLKRKIKEAKALLSIYILKTALPDIAYMQSMHEYLQTLESLLKRFE